jgi:hypothetical protein
MRSPFMSKRSAGALDLIASFGDHIFTVATTDAA